MESKLVSILCIGDSHTAGFPLYDPYFGGDHSSSYEYWLEIKLQKQYPEYSFSLENRGVCGEFSTDILYRLKNIPNIQKYNFILIWGGANDIGMNKPINTILNALQKAEDYCEQNSVPYFFLTIPPMNILGLNKQVIELNAQMYEKFPTKVIDVYSDLNLQGSLKQEYRIGDGVHLSIDGYHQVAKTIFNELMLLKLF
jgi:lysophospholipase L1-like esterase